MPRGIKKSRVTGLPMNEILALAEIGDQVMTHAPGLAQMLSGKRKRRARKEEGAAPVSIVEATGANGKKPKAVRARAKAKAKTAKAAKATRPAAISVGDE